MLIRRATSSDAPFIAHTYRPFVEDHWASFETRAPTADEIAARIEKAADAYPWLIAEADSQLGYAYASPHRSRAAYQTSVDTAIYCAETAQGKGVGRSLYQKLFEVLIAQNFVTAFAGIAMPNEASVSLHRSLGFELVGTYPNVGFKHGAWRDTTWWSRPLRTPQDPPAALRSVSQAFAV